MSATGRLGIKAALALAVTAIVAWAALAERSGSADQAEPARKIENFTLNDARGGTHSLADWAGKKVIVVAFMGTECPLANLYTPRLAELASQYAANGVQFVFINSNQQDSVVDVANHAQRHNLTFPVLKDAGNKIADRFGAVRTPEIFVLDTDRTVRYRGRIDDQYGVGFQKQKANRNDLAIAIDELLAGKPVSRPSTEVAGCIIGRVKRAAPTGDVTYSNQIARVLQAHCIECHHEGEVAPFSLTNYDEVVGWGEMIREVVHQRRMPPWLASAEYGHFKNDPSLAKEEVEAIDRWVENGCPQGKPGDLPAPTDVAKGWGISEPDQVFYMSDKPYQIPAEGVVDYQIYTVDPGFTEDHWIQEAEVKAGNPAVVHHVIVFIQEPGGSRFGIRKWPTRPA